MRPVCFNLRTHPHSPTHPPTHTHLLVYVEEKLERLRRKPGRVGEAVVLQIKGPGREGHRLACHWTPYPTVCIHFKEVLAVLTRRARPSTVRVFLVFPLPWKLSKLLLKSWQTRRRGQGRALKCAGCGGQCAQHVTVISAVLPGSARSAKHGDNLAPNNSGRFKKSWG